MLIILVVLSAGEGEGLGGDGGASGPLRYLSSHELEAILPAGTTLMMGPAAIEEFLAELDG